MEIEEQKEKNKPMALVMKTRDNSKGQLWNRGDREQKKCSNCKKSGHVKEGCFAPGGGKKNNAPEWWKK